MIKVKRTFELILNRVAGQFAKQGIWQNILNEKVIYVEVSSFLFLIFNIQLSQLILSHQGSLLCTNTRNKSEDKRKGPQLSSFLNYRLISKFAFNSIKHNNSFNL